MRTRAKVVRFLSITVFILLAIVCIIHYVNENHNLYWLTLLDNIIIGIIGSTIVSLVIYYKEYTDAKRETLILFFNKTRSILNRLNEYEYGDTKFTHVDNNIEVLKDAIDDKVSELSTIYGDINFLWDRHNCYGYITSIYKLFIDLSLLLAREIQFISMGGHDLDTLRSIDCVLHSINNNMVTIYYYIGNMLSIINGRKIHGKFKLQNLDICKLIFAEQDTNMEESIRKIIEWYKSSPSFMLDLLNGFPDEYKQKYFEELTDWYDKHPQGTFTIYDVDITQEQIDSLSKKGYLSLVHTNRYYPTEILLSYFNLKEMKNNMHKIECKSNIEKDINMSDIKLELRGYIK